jgi:hypothetical protein
MTIVMPESLPSDDPLAAVSDTFRGSSPNVRDLLAGVQQRAQARARDEISNRIDDVVVTARGQNDVSRAPTPAPLPQPVPRPAANRPVQITLRNGHRIRATLSPALARRSELTALARVGAANDRKAFANIRRQHDALAALRQSHDELARKVAAMQEQSDQALVGLLQGFAGLEQRVQVVNTQSQTVLTSKGPIRTLAVQQRRELQALALNARIQSVTNVVNSAQSAAFGQRGSIFATNNLVLAGNQLFWSFLDPFLRSAGIVEGVSPSVLAILAPLGSLLTGQIALGDQQHERFISGIAVFDGTNSVAIESLRAKIASGLWAEFQRRTNIPVTAVPLDPAAVAIRAEVRQGVLLVTILTPRFTAFAESPPTLRVAWMVDTGADVG